LFIVGARFLSICGLFIGPAPHLVQASAVSPAVALVASVLGDESTFRDNSFQGLMAQAVGAEAG